MKAERAASLLVAAIALPLLVWWYASKSPNDGDGHGPSAGARQSTEDLDSKVSTEAPEPAGQRERLAAGSGVLRGRVRSDVGKPLVGARVLWLALQARDVEANTALPIEDWGLVRRSFVETNTNAQGEFQFEKPPEAPIRFGSVLTAYHPGHFAGGMDIGPTPEQSGRVEIVLKDGEDITVRVLDPSGIACKGAAVWQQSHPSPSPDGLESRRWTTLLGQTATTDASGSARIPPLPGRQTMWAERGEFISRPWHGPATAEVILHLGASFTVGGTITLPEWSPDYEGERRLLISGVDKCLSRPLVRLRDAVEGKWGPVRVPLDGSSRYTVRLEGPPICPIEVSLNAPPASSYCRVDLNPQKAEDLYICVRDELEKPIATATAVVSWGSPANSGTSLSANAAARSDGYIYVGSMPAGSIRFDVSAPGYGRVVGEGQLPSEQAYLVVLPLAGSVSGRCLRNGMPVTDFKIVYWNAGTVRYESSTQFFDRNNGTFQIGNLGSGTWTFMAADAVHPGGRPVTVDVEVGQETSIELELPVPILGGGRVVAADTGEVISGARIQVYSSGGLVRSAPWGEPVLSDSRGEFDLEAFVIGSNYISVEADGYARLDAQAQATNSELLDWGDLRLNRPRALQLSLLAVDQLTTFALKDLRVGTYEGFLLPEIAFTPQGVARFEEVPPGDHKLLISYPDGSYARLHLQLEPGKDLAIDHKIAGDRYLTVRATRGDGQPLAFDAQVLVAAQENGRLVVRMRRSERGVVNFEGIQAPGAEILVYDELWKIVGSKTFSFEGRSMLEVQVALESEPLRVSVLDPDGAPLPNAWVTVRSADGSKILGLDDTDVDGVAELVGLPPEMLMMDVRHGIAGWCQGVAIDAAVIEHEFVLEARSSIELLFKDGDQPLAGVSTQVQAPGGVALRDSKVTDDRGGVRYEPLGRGSYNIACRRGDCWPVVLDHDLGADEHAKREVQMRRLGDARIGVRSRDGLPVSAVEIELRSEEFGDSVAAWLAAGRVESATGLVSDRRGEILVEGLPRGRYTWSVPAAEGSGSGAFELVPGDNGEVLIQLAE